MFERFTKRARQVIVFAQDEARTFRHNYAGTEHLLLGLLREEEGLAARVLESLDITLEDVRAQVAQIVGHGDELSEGKIPYTPRVKRVLDLSLREAMSLGHNYVGTEHLLLSLVREDEGVATQILLNFDAEATTIRNEIIRMLSDPGRRPGTDRPRKPRLASPPVDAQVAEEVERLRAQKEELIEAQEFEQAAKLRDRERRLLAAGRELERAWQDDLGGPQRVALDSGAVTYRQLPRPAPRATAAPEPRRAVLGAVVLGWLLFGGAAGVGLVVGWLLWG
ncbi:MAG TPA: Clp protease N-terminal domain-containing protein [Gaiellaceae bacterium]